MFIVKAEIRSNVGPANYELFTSTFVRVAKPGGDCAQSPGIPPDLYVYLGDDRTVPAKEILGVGYGLDQYAAVYIMNDRGKTIDTVYPGPEPIRSAANVPVSMVGR